MKYLSRIGAIAGLIGCIAGLILCAANRIDFGTWDIPAFIIGIVFCVLCLSWRGILTFIVDRFDIEYSKDTGLTVKEEKAKHEA